MDQMTLNVLEKYQKYGQVDLLPFFQLIQVTLVVTIVVLIYIPESEYIQLNQDQFEDVFLEDEIVETGSIVLLQDLLDQIEETVDNYFNLQNITIKKYDYPVNPAPPITLSVLWFVGEDTEISIYHLTEDDPFGPFNNTDLREFANQVDFVVKMEMSFELYSSSVSSLEDYTDWIITVQFDNEYDAFMDVSLILERNYHYTHFNYANLITLVLLVICGFTAVGNVIQIFLKLRVYLRTYRRFNRISKTRLRVRFTQIGIRPPPTEWSQVPLGIRIEFFSPWSIYSLLGDLFIISASATSLSLGLRPPLVPIERLIFGLGSFILFTRMNEYLEIFPNFYTLIITLRYASSKMLRYVISILPLIFAFALCGLTLFGPYSTNFSDYYDTFVTLFSIMNGDEVHDTINEMAESYPVGSFLPRLYMILFALLFIPAIMNVFIFIIEDAFHLAKLISAKYHKDYETLPDTVVAMYGAEWQALHRMLDMEKLFLVLDAELYGIESLPIQINSTQDDPDYAPEIYYVNSLRTRVVEKTKELFGSDSHHVSYTPLPLEDPTDPNFTADESAIEESDLNDPDFISNVFEKHQAEFLKDLDHHRKKFVKGLNSDMIKFKKDQSSKIPYGIQDDDE